ncbi:MAG TPA: CaiB/BaiF CoA-transferase family protein [Acidimicrobiales bacterium]|nr:CaiB/BaiF CoA-transferase family protein [Acidimicrobiales bacterium]
MTPSAQHPALLEGLRVLDLGIFRPVPYATQLLVEMGADVIKIEPPGGDPMRVFPPLFEVLNAGKRNEVVDLKDEGGRVRVLALAAGADVFMEGFRPGVADRLGVGYEALAAVNPSIVYCSISGYGASGPLAQVPGHDANYQAYAAVLTPTGGRPKPGTLPVGDLGAGMAAAMAVLAGCWRARATGEGERIDIGITDVLATWTGAVGTMKPRGSPLPMNGLPGYGVYPTADDRYLALGVLAEPHFWAGLCAALQLDALAGIELNERIRRKEELDAEVAAAIARRTQAEAQKALEAHDVPVAPVLDRGEMLALEHFRTRGTVLAEAPTLTGGGPAMGHPAVYHVHPARPPGRVPTLDGEGSADGDPVEWLAR